MSYHGSLVRLELVLLNTRRLKAVLRGEVVLRLRWGFRATFLSQARWLRFLPPLLVTPMCAHFFDASPGAAGWVRVRNGEHIWKGGG